MVADDKGSKKSEADLNSILSRAAAAKRSEYPKQVYPASETGGGVIPNRIAGRFDNERERLGPDFDETQRQWRIKWHQDQHLHHKEPVAAAQKALDKELKWFFRRWYAKPMDWVQTNILEGKLKMVSIAN